MPNYSWHKDIGHYEPASKTVNVEKLGIGWVSPSGWVRLQDGTYNYIRNLPAGARELAEGIAARADRFFKDTAAMGEGAPSAGQPPPYGAAPVTPDPADLVEGLDSPEITDALAKRNLTAAADKSADPFAVQLAGSRQLAQRPELNAPPAPREVTIAGGKVDINKLNDVLQRAAEGAKHITYGGNRFAEAVADQKGIDWDVPNVARAIEGGLTEDELARLSRPWEHLIGTRAPDGRLLDKNDAIAAARDSLTAGIREWVAAQGKAGGTPTRAPTAAGPVSRADVSKALVNAAAGRDYWAGTGLRPGSTGALPEVISPPSLGLPPGDQPVYRPESVAYPAGYYPGLPPGDQPPPGEGPPPPPPPGAFGLAPTYDRIRPEHEDPLDWFNSLTPEMLDQLGIRVSG